VSRRAIVIGVICLGALGIANIIVLAIYVPRLLKSAAPKPAVAEQHPQTSAPVSSNSPAAAPAATPAPARAPLPDGAVVQREEVSPSGKIRIKYLRSKGNPVRQIVLENVARPGDSKVFFEHERNAWVLVSPDDEWIALNNRPSAGRSELQLYHRQRADTLNYEIPEGFRDGDGRPENAVWHSYLEAIGLPPETQRESVTIDATGWENDSKKLNVSVAVTPSDANDSVPMPWSCTFDVATKQIDTPPETAQAFQQQEQAQSPAEEESQRPLAAHSSQNAPLEGTFPGERYPITRTRVLTEDELTHWSLANIQYAINEIYARRGADFPDKPEIRRQFSRFSWYQPQAQMSMEQIETQFSDLEKQNAELLGKARDGKQSAARQRRTVHGQPSPDTSERIMRDVLRGIRDGPPNQ
jgi:YARHG domain